MITATSVLLGLFVVIWTYIIMSLLMVMSGRPQTPDGPDCDDGMIDVFHGNLHWPSFRPDDNTELVLMAGFIARRSPLAPAQQFAFSVNASLDPLGIINGYQLLHADGTTFDHSRPISITRTGIVRVLAGEAIATDILVCSDLTARLRPFVVGVDDARALIGRSRSVATAAAEWVTVELSIGS